MPADGDIAELAEKAKLLAEASGRTEEDVMGDLLDDGVLNESNQKGDLIEQAQEKVDRFRKLMASMIPLILVLGGGAGVDALGIADLHDIGEDVMDDLGRGGCMYEWADNFDSRAVWDDGTCQSTMLENPAFMDGCYFLIYETTSDEFDESNPTINQTGNDGEDIYVTIDPDEVFGCGQRVVELKLVVYESGSRDVIDIWNQAKIDYVIDHDATELVNLSVLDLPRGTWDIVVCMNYGDYEQAKVEFTGRLVN